MTVTEGPSTYIVETTTSSEIAGETIAVAVGESCALEGTTLAACTATYSVSADGTATSDVTTQTLTGTDYHRFDVAITAGADKTASATGSCNAGGKSSGASGAGVDARGVGVLGLLLSAGLVGVLVL